MPVVDWPALEATPRIEIELLRSLPNPPPRWKWMPGARRAMSSTARTPCTSICAWLKAVTLTGTSWMLSARRVAVTTISSSESDACGVLVWAWAAAAALSATATASATRPEIPHSAGETLLPWCAMELSFRFNILPPVIFQSCGLDDRPCLPVNVAYSNSMLGHKRNRQSDSRGCTAHNSKTIFQWSPYRPGMAGPQVAKPTQRPRKTTTIQQHNDTAPASLAMAGGRGCRSQAATDFQVNTWKINILTAARNRNTNFS